MSSQTRANKVLVVDDAPATLEVIGRNLESKGLEVYTANSVVEGLRVLESTSIDLVITDLKMPKASGLDLVKHVRENCRDTEIMMITGYATVNGAVEAMKAGAEEYLSKPFTDEELFAAVRQALKKLQRRRAGHARQVPGEGCYPGLIGRSEAMNQVFRAISKAAATKATVLLTGESGTGKDLVARAIHYGGSRAASPFVPINCGGIPEGLLESELFGHVKGAFTGAGETRAGFFQTADGGTIFLDEISETSAAMQVKLLRVLQDKKVCMIGDHRAQEVDVRIIAATNRDLAELVKKGSFREDLFFRLNVISIHIPPLRHRGDDILFMAGHFAKKYADEFEKPCPVVTDRALAVLRNYGWPGNVRELENLFQRLVVMTEEDLIDAPDLPSHMRFSVPREAGLNRSLAEVEAEHIKNVIVSVGGNKTKASKILGIDRKTLREKLNKTGDSSEQRTSRR